MGVILTILVAVLLVSVALCLVMLVGIAHGQNKVVAQLERVDQRVSVIEIDREINGECENTMQTLRDLARLPAKIRES